MRANASIYVSAYYLGKSDTRFSLSSHLREVTGQIAAYRYAMKLLGYVRKAFACTRSDQEVSEADS